MEILGNTYTRRELAARTGDLTQVAGIERFTYDEGVQGGVRAARVRTGAGLDFTVLLSRGMDIGAASINGVPFAWVSATSVAHPHAYVPTGHEGRGWLQTFHGGLLTGCGITQAGAAGLDDDELLGIHGRLSHLPAEDTATRTEWDGDEAYLVVEGTIREATIFGENIRLHRTIRAKVGTNTFSVTDTVTNEGFKTSPLMLLYHLNYGWPLVEEGTEIIFPDGTKTTPRDETATKGQDNCYTLDAPTPNYAEQCFFHDIPADNANNASVTMTNFRRGLSVTMQWNKTQFPHCIEWKMMGEGEYVCGIEPANCLVMGRAAEREAGRLQHIAPGETRKFGVTITARKG
jgi:Domain of unknown function (DUF4432)